MNIKEEINLEIDENLEIFTNLGKIKNDHWLKD